MDKDYIIDGKIYKVWLLKKVILDFSDVAEIEYKKGKLNIKWNNESEIEQIFNEFMNYYVWLAAEK